MAEQKSILPASQDRHKIIQNNVAKPRVQKQIIPLPALQLRLDFAEIFHTSTILHVKYTFQFFMSHNILNLHENKMDINRLIANLRSGRL